MKDSIVRTETGSLAGSTLQLIDGVKNLYNWSGSPLYEIWNRASLSPAMSLGRDSQLGSIAIGKIADYVVIDDDFFVQDVTVAGVMKYCKNQ